MHARFLLYLGEYQEADEIFESIVPTMETAVAAVPNQLSFRTGLDRVLYGHAVTLQKLGKDTESQDAFQRLIEVRHGLLAIEPDNVTRQISLALAMARGGEFEPAKQLADAVRKSIDQDATVLYHLACAYAQLAGLSIANEQADPDPLVQAAIGALRAAQRAGFYRPTDLRMDPDLEPIRGIEAFEKLLADATAAAG